ncbi:MAG: acetamidase, partial [Acidiphilium sp. 37-67-22]
MMAKATNWIASSIVARRGVGWARKPRVHNLTEEMQGQYHYTIGPYSEPVLTIEPGDRIVVETRDAFEGAIRTERDK